MKNGGQNVECDSCPWAGKEAELDTVKLENGDDAECCPVCNDLGISRLGFGE